MNKNKDLEIINSINNNDKTHIIFCYNEKYLNKFYKRYSRSLIMNFPIFISNDFPNRAKEIAKKLQNDDSIKTIIFYDIFIANYIEKDKLYYIDKNGIIYKFDEYIRNINIHLSNNLLKSFILQQFISNDK